MRRVIAGLLTAGVVGTSGGLGTGTARANPWYPQPCDNGPYPAESCVPPSPLVQGSTAQTVYALGGARAPGIPWYEYTMKAGADWFPDARRELIDYPAGAPFSWMPQFVLPPGPRDMETIGEAATQATTSLDNAIAGGSGTQAAVGLSQGTLALDQVQARLANDPNAPAPDQLTFTTIGDPTSRHAFGQSFLSEVFGPGEYIPLIDYTMPPAVESQYNSNRVVAMYDGLADFPDRPQNVFAVANAVAGSAITHTPAAFTSPDMVPPQNIRSEVNSRGATTTSFLIPVTDLPLTLPLRYLGVPSWGVDMLDGALQPIIDAGYSRNDDPATRPVTVTPAGMDPIGSLDPGTRAAIEKTFADARSLFGVLG
ncbi:MAG: PE-PPE domain-containing protein [Mycobacterium sp.]|nr:PE-PPE domain-containing protein [Mycobacterium sp.]